MQNWLLKKVSRYRGCLMGVDGFGNHYFQHKTMPKKRWVVYAGRAEASHVPPLWHGWLHGLSNKIPDTSVGHQGNQTGTDQAYHLAKPTAACKGYEPWQPGA